MVSIASSSSRAFLLLLVLVSLVAAVAAAPLALPIATAITCGQRSVLNKMGTAYEMKQYCTFSQSEVSTVNDFGVFVHMVRMIKKDKNTYRFVTNIPWIYKQESVTLKGFFSGIVTVDEIFHLDLQADPKGWDKYIDFANRLIAPMTAAACRSGNEKMVTFFKYLPAALPNVVIDPTETDANVLVQTFQFFYFSSIDPVYRHHAFIQFIAWASSTGRFDVIFHPFMQSTLAETYPLIINIHGQKAKGYIQVVRHWDPFD